MKTIELTGATLDWGVAFALYGEQAHYIYKHNAGFHRYSTDWAQGGPIIEREGIDVFCNVPTNPQHPDPAWRGSWKACYHRMGFGTAPSYGPTPLIAAMRCLVCSKLGDTVELPKELT